MGCLFVREWLRCPSNCVFGATGKHVAVHLPCSGPSSPHCPLLISYVRARAPTTQPITDPSHLTSLPFNQLSHHHVPSHPSTLIPTPYISLSPIITIHCSFSSPSYFPQFTNSSLFTILLLPASPRSYKPITTNITISHPRSHHH